MRMLSGTAMMQGFGVFLELLDGDAAHCGLRCDRTPARLL